MRSRLFFSFIHACLWVTVLAQAVALAADGDFNPLQAYAKWMEGREAQSLSQFVRRTVTRLLSEQKPDLDDEHIPWLRTRVGVFVTAMKGRRVRACVGTFHPKQTSLSSAIVRQCKRLTASDPRSRPLEINELSDIRFVITLAGLPHSVSDPHDVDIYREGLVMEWQGREAALLPGEAKTAEWGIQFLKKQIHVPERETPYYASFPVIVLEESRKNGDSSGFSAQP